MSKHVRKIIAPQEYRDKKLHVSRLRIAWGIYLSSDLASCVECFNQRKHTLLMVTQNASAVCLYESHAFSIFSWQILQPLVPSVHHYIKRVRRSVSQRRHEKKSIYEHICHLLRSQSRGRRMPRIGFHLFARKAKTGVRKWMKIVTETQTNKTSRPINQSRDPWIDESVNRSISKSINQSIND